MTNELNKLYDDVVNCQRCQLSKLYINETRIKSKTGTGSVLIISQNPSCYKEGHETVMGGFDKLRSIELNELLKDCYITNIIKCSFEKNVVPINIDKIVETCNEWILKEIRDIHPKLIIVVGKIAKKYLPIREIYKLIPHVDITYVNHPMYYIHCGRQHEIISTMVSLLKTYNKTKQVKII